MTATTGSAEVLALADYHEAGCNRYINGECQMRRCLARGGWKIGNPVDYSKATCEAHETALALRLAAKPAEDVQRQLDRANKIIAWMMPYIGTMCPPQNGLGELNDHCFQNGIRPNFDDETKGRPINQSGILPNPAALSTTGQPKP